MDRLKSLLSPGESSAKTAAEISRQCPSSIFATAGHQVFFWDEDTSLVRSTKLDRTGDSTVLQLKPVIGRNGSRINHSVHKIAVNETGTYLALIGDCDASVIRLPEDRGTPYGGGHNNMLPPVPCRARSIGAVHNATGIAQASWHPFSRDCLVVLNCDGKLRFYDVYERHASKDFPLAIDHPDLELLVGPDATHLGGLGLAPDLAVAFDFGSANGWDMFTIYVVLETGEITYFCPVVPSGSAISKSAFTAIRGTPEAETKECQQWLQEIRPRHVNDKTDNFESGAAILLEQPKSRKAYARYQGPMKCDVDDSIGMDGAVGLLVLASEPTVMVVADDTGTIKISVLTEEVKPAWTGQNPPVPTHAVLEIIDLQLHSGKDIQLLRDPKFAERFYAFHCEGIHSVESKYVGVLMDAFSRPDDEDSGVLPNTFNSTLREVLCTKSGTVDSQGLPLTNAVDGMLILSGPLVGYHLIAVTENCSLIVEMLSDMKRNESQLETILNFSTNFDNSINTTGDATSAFYHRVEKLVKDSPDFAITNTVPGSDISTFSAMVKESLSNMRTKYIQPILKGQLDLDKRGRQLEEAEKVQKEQISNLEKELAERMAENERIREDTSICHENMEQLMEYMEMLVSHYNSVMHVTSDAELEYRKTIESLDKESFQIVRHAGKVRSKFQRAQKSGMLGKEKKRKEEPTMSKEELAKWEEMRDSRLDLLSTKISSLTLKTDKLMEKGI